MALRTECGRCPLDPILCKTSMTRCVLLWLLENRDKLEKLLGKAEP